MNGTDTGNAQSPARRAAAAQRLGADRGLIHLARSSEVHGIAVALACQAQRTLQLFSPDLEAALYDRQDFLDAVTALVRRHPGATFDVLVHDVSRAVRHGHRLVELARRLDSSVRIRRCALQYRGYCAAFLLADGCGYLYRPLSSRYEGLACFNDSGEAGRLGNYFREVWEHSEPDTELRRLHL